MTPATFQSLLDSITGPQTSDICIRLGAGTYSQTVYIANKSFIPPARLYISTDAGAAGQVVFQGANASGGVFEIRTERVTLQNFQIRASGSSAYGVAVGSANVALAGMVVLDPLGFIDTAALVVESTGTQIASSSFTAVGGASPRAARILASATGTTISLSTMTNGGSSQPTLDIAAASVTVTGSYVQAGNTGDAVRIGAAAQYVTIALSSVVATGSGPALELNNAYYAKLASSTFANTGGGSGVILGSAYHNVFELVKAQGAGGSEAFYAASSSGNVVMDSFVQGSGGDGFVLDTDATLNTVLRSTVTTAGNAMALRIMGGASQNLVQQSYVGAHGAGGGTGLRISGGFNTVLQSTTASRSAAVADAALVIGGAGADDNLVSGGFAYNGAGTGILIENGAADNHLLGVRVQVTTGGAQGFGGGVVFADTSTNTVTALDVFSRNASGLYLLRSSSITVNGGVFVSSSSGNLSLAHAGIMLDNSWQNELNGVAASNLGVEPAIELYQSSSNTLTNVSAIGISTESVVSFTQAAANLVQTSSFTCLGQGPAFEMQAGGLNSVAGSSITAVQTALKVSGASANTVSASVLRTSTGTAVLLDTASDHVFTSDWIVTTSTHPKEAYTDLNGLNNALVTSLIHAPLTRGAAVKLLGAGAAQVSGSTVTAGFGAGVLVQGASGAAILDTRIFGSTGVFVDGSQNTLVSLSTVSGTLFSGVSVINAPANSTATISNSVVYGTQSVHALFVSPGAASAVTNLSGLVELKGRAAVMSGGLVSQGNETLFGGDLRLGAPAWVTAAVSSFTFNGAQQAPPATAQTLTVDPGPALRQLDHVLLNVSSFSAAGDGFAAVQVRDLIPGTTVGLRSGTAMPYAFANLELRGAVGPGNRVTFRSLQADAAASAVVGASTVTLAQVTDIDGSAGPLQHANDLTSVNGGGNVNWNFLPFLHLAVNGMGFVDVVGSTGSAATQPAGPVTVVVRAHSSAPALVPAANFQIALGGDEINVSTLTQTLAGGVAVFELLLKRGESASPPFIHVLTATAAASNVFQGASYSLNMPVVPGALAKLQTLVPGEFALPGSLSGKGGAPLAASKSVPYSVLVRGVDQFWNKNTSASDSVVLATSAANLPLTQSLASGATTFGVVFTSSGTSRRVVATDVTAPAITASTSAFFNVFDAAGSSPTVTVNIASGSVQSTLSGFISGTASDPVAVSHVSVKLQRLSDSLFFDFNAGAFSSPTSISSAAPMTAPNAPLTSWGVPIPDSVLTNNVFYYVTVISSNPAGNTSVAASQFKFVTGTGQAGSQKDGAGTGAVGIFDPNNYAAALTTTCGVAVASVTFTAGPLGVDPGGAVALRLPNTWRPPIQLDPGPNPVVGPGSAGHLVVGSTGSFSVSLNPAQVSSATFGDGWIVYEALNGLGPGQKVFFTYTGRVGGAAGPQPFTFLVRGAGAGNFKPIANQPAPVLNPGPARNLVYSEELPLTVGPLQTSTTMQLVVVDACGNSTNTAANLNVFMFARMDGGTVDGGGQYYSAGGLPISPDVSPLTIPGGTDRTPAFYFATASPGPFGEQLSGTAVFPGSQLSVAQRFIKVLDSPVSIANVSVDTGTLSPGVVKATVTAGSFSGGAVINFTLSDPSVPWELIISTSNATFSPELVHRVGSGQPGRGVVWHGLDERSFPQTLTRPGGPYYVKIRAGHGVAEDTSLQVFMATTPFVYGTVNSTGAFAYVRAEGPDTNHMHATVADGTGYFELHGLRAGGRYNIVASTGRVIGGQFTQLQASSNNVTASLTGHDAGAMPFPTLSLLRVRVQVPLAAPHEFWGGLGAVSNDGRQQARGTLHFPAGFDKSDDGFQSFGANASTWTMVNLLPGAYTLDLQLHQVGISSRIPGVVVGPGTNDLFVALQRKASAFGYLVTPSTTPFGTWVSVQGQKAGESRPSVFGGRFLQGASPGPAQSSGVYTLFGLDPGTWTITAQGFGFGSASTSVFVSSSADVGDPLTGGLDLSLTQGSVLNGRVSITGDSTELPGMSGSQNGLTVSINAFNPQTRASGFAQVFIATSATLATSTFSITGLDDGTYFLHVHVPGATIPQLSTAVSAGSGYATLTAPVDSARALITVKLPAAPAPDTSKVSLYFKVGAGSQLIQNLALTPGTTVYASSMTWRSPVFGPGYGLFYAVYSKTGMFRSVPLPLTNGAPTPAVLDLSGSTFTVSGTVALAGNVDFELPNGAVSVSSVPGILANAGLQQYCLTGRSTPFSTSTFHLELLPVARRGGYKRDDLVTLAQAGDCAVPSLDEQADGEGSPEVNPLHAYVADINPNGSFSIPNVPPGNYLLRVPRGLSGGAAPGPDHLPPVRQSVTVTTSSVAGLIFHITRGVTVSGKVRMPPGLQASRFIEVSLLDAKGETLRRTGVNFLDANTAAYSIDRVPDGVFALVVQDFGYPRSFGARPVKVNVAAAPVSQDIQLVQTGVIKGKMAVKQFLPASATAQFLLVTRHNLGQLPRSLKIYAEAQPWFEGGRVGAFAGGPGGGGERPVLDANDQFLIEGVLPGAYNVHFETESDPNDPAAIRPVNSVAPGVSVAGNAVTDLGTYNLAAGVQVRGRVYDVVTNSPIANVSISAQPALSQSKESRELFAITDASGTYTLVGFDPGVKAYDFYANRRFQGNTPEAAPPYELKIDPAVDVTSVTVVDFALTPAAFSVSGRVRGTPGGPPLRQPFGAGAGSAAGAMVFFQRSGVVPRDNPISDLILGTDAEGRFTIPSLTTGTYKLTAAALGYGSASKTVLISTASVDLGTITLSFGSTLSGALRKPDGSAPGLRELDNVVAVTSDFSQIIPGTLEEDPNTQTYTDYRISGFQPGSSYRVLFFGRGAKSAAIAPAEVRAVVFSTTTESRTQDVVLRPAAPFAFAKSKRSGTAFRVRFELSQALRQKTAADDDLALVLSTFSAGGSLSQRELDASRTLLTALYTPGVSESSFTLRLRGYSTQTDPDSLDPADPQFLYSSTFSFFSGIDGFYENYVSNFNGGTLIVEDDPGRVTIPGGAFQVDSSSSIAVGLALSNESLAGAATSGLKGAAANLSALRYKGSAYPPEILQAVAATPPSVSPFSGFYNILLPLGIRTALLKPVPMTIKYSTSTDPTTLNLYWYNAAANAYVLQQDVTGAPPVIDYANQTITINVNHFSTFVLFNTGVAVISGNAFAGAFHAYNFPNPFDLASKTVTPIHGVGVQTVRGTMVSVAVPADVSGGGSIRIFNVAGEKVRTIDLGTVSGGQYLYQAWDGRNDSGRDCASGVYIGQVKVGEKSTFFKMALIK